MLKSKIIIYVDTETVGLGAWKYIVPLLKGMEVCVQICAFSERDSTSSLKRKNALELFCFRKILAKNTEHCYSDLDIRYVVIDMGASETVVEQIRLLIPASAHIFDFRDEPMIRANELVSLIFRDISKEDLDGKGSYVSFSMDLELYSHDDLKKLYLWLDWLSMKNIVINFFVTGASLDIINGSNDIISLLLKHQIGNHTFDHINSEYVTIVRNHDYIESFLNKTPVCFRAPRLEPAKDMFLSLEKLGYSIDSSLFGMHVFPVITNGRNMGIIEVPVIDGGDYYYLCERRMDTNKYLAFFKRKLSQIASFNPSFSILFHNQYSTLECWQNTIEIIMETGYSMITMEEQTNEYLRVLA